MLELLASIFFMSTARGQMCEFSRNPPFSSISGLIAGFKELKRTLTLEQAKDVFKSFATDPIFHMNDPDGLCYNRTQLIGKQLESLGIYSEQLNIQCPGTFLHPVDPFSGRVYKYGSHWANVIKVVNPISKATEEFVLDTQFQVEPIPLKVYVNNIVGIGYKISESNTDFTSFEQKMCAYRRVDRRSFLELKEKVSGTAGNQKSRAPTWFDSRIAWDEKALDHLRLEVNESNEHYPKPARGTPLEQIEITNAKIKTTIRDLDASEKQIKMTHEEGYAARYGPVSVEEKRKLDHDAQLELAAIAEERYRLQSQLKQ